MSDDVTIKFGADIADLKSKVDEVMGTLGKVTTVFAEMAAVVAGGEAFKEFISTASEMNAAAERMSRTLGITAAEAGDIGVAIKDVGARMGVGSASADTYTQAFVHFTRTLRTGGDAAKAMGVDVDALKNGTKTSNQVFQESLGIISRYAPGFDQNAAAMTLFGRRIGDVQLLMGLTNEQMEEAHKKAVALNLTISQEGVDAASKYRGAMNEVHDVLEGVAKTIGEGVMPHFTAMAEKLATVGPTIVQVTQLAVEALVNLWDTLREIVGTVWETIKTVIDLFSQTWQQLFGHDGPGAMEIFKNALRLVEILFIGFRVSFELSASMIKTGLVLMGEYFTRFADVADRALHFDFAGAKSAWKSGVAEHNRILDEGMQDMVRIAAKGAADMDKAANGTMGSGPGTPAGSAAGTGKRRFDPTAGGGKDANTMAAMLALQKAQQEAARALEQEYLKEAQSMYDEAYKNGLTSTKEYYDAKLAIEIKSIDSSLQAKKQELENAQKAEAEARSKSGSAATPQDRNKFEAQTLKFQTEAVKLTGEINVLEAQRVDAVRKTSDAYADVSRKVNADLQAIATGRAKTAADNEVAIERAALTQKLSMRQITAQQGFDVERQLEAKSYAALQTDLQARRAAIFGSQDEIKLQQAKLDAEAETAEQQHQLRLKQIDDAAVLERNQLILNAQTQIENSIESLLSSLGDSSKSLGDKLKALAKSIEQTFMDLAAKQIGKQIFGSLTGSFGGDGGGWLGGMLNSVFGGLHSFDVGTSFVPQDMIAKVHKGERIITAADNAAGRGGMQVVQHFALSGPTDARTQQQIAGAAARGLSVAARRNG